MIVSLLLPSVGIAYVIKGWASPPCTQGCAQIECDNIRKTHFYRADDKIASTEFVVRCDGVEATLKMDNLEWMAYEAGDQPTPPILEISIPLCASCGKTHEAIMAQPLKSPLLSMGTQFVGHCPETGAIIYIQA